MPTQQFFSYSMLILNEIKLINKMYNEWVSKWLFFKTNSAIFQLYYSKNKLSFTSLQMDMSPYSRQIISITSQPVFDLSP